MVVRDRDSSDPEQPDNSRIIVGSDGEYISQTLGRMVTREGVVAEDADWDINGHNLVQDGDYRADPENIGGTSIINMFLESQTGGEFSVAFEIYGDNEERLGTVEPPEFQNRTKVNDKHGVYSDKMQIVISDESGNGSNVINGSINIHSGGASSVKLLNSDGEVVDPAWAADIEELNVELSDEFDELRDEFSNTSQYESVDSSSGDFSVVLDTGGRASVNFSYSVSEVVEVDIEVSSDEETWFPYDDPIEVEDVGNEQFPWMGHRYVRASCDKEGVQMSFELSASR